MGRIHTQDIYIRVQGVKKRVPYFERYNSIHQSKQKTFLLRLVLIIKLTYLYLVSRIFENFILINSY